MESEFYRDREEEKRAVRRFEEMLRNRESVFLTLETYEQIIDHYADEGKFKQALHACNLAVEQYPYSTDLLLDMAHLMVQNQQPKEALEILEKLSLFHPADLEVMLLKGSIHNLLGDFEEAVGILENALPFAEDSAQVHYQLGLAYQNWSKYREAIVHYKACIEKNMSNEAALYELAFCLDAIGELEVSLTYYEAFIDKDPFSFNAWYNLGIAYSKLERFEEAAGAYEYATLLKEDFASAHFNRGNAFMNLRQYALAKECYESTLRHEEPTPDVCCCLGAACEKLGQTEEALTHYRKATKIEPLWDEGWFGIAVCLNLQEKWYESIHFSRKALKINEENYEYWMLLAECEAKIGNVISAAEAYEQAANLAPFQAEVWLNWSLLFYEQGDYAKAVQLVVEGMEDNPKEAEMYYRATVYLLHGGQYKQAFEYLETALTLDFDKHILLFDFFQEIEQQKALYRIIQEFKDGQV
jgi:tetratricopeptide (TPR) repeat protein